jgi:Sec-independent protein translocase protein TatA
MRDMGQGITAFKKGLKEEKKDADGDAGPAIENADASVPKDKAAS